MGSQMKLFILTACLLCWPSLAFALSISSGPVEHVAAPGGRVVYYIMSFPGNDSAGNPNREIEAGIDDNSSFDILLTPHPSSDPRRNLDDFSKLFLSPNGKTLYFQTTAWATSDAIHSLNITTKKTSYVTDGEIACVVLNGEYQGDLVVQQHRYFVQGGSYNDLYLYDPAGKEIGIVSQNVDTTKVCPSLGN